MEARLFVEQDLATGRTLELGVGQARYLHNVLRLVPGAEVALCNGRDGEWSALIETLDRQSARLAPVSMLRPQRAEADLWLVFAPLKRAAQATLLRQAVELGVAGLQPVITRHSAVRKLNAERMRSQAIEAAEQCERMTLPEIRNLAPLEQILVDWPHDRRLVVCVERHENLPVTVAPILDIFAQAGSQTGGQTGNWAVMTGPEGGFAPEELEMFARFPFISCVTLGTRILRADTAATAALACWQMALGEGRDT